jgi:hypothetical protein
MEKQPVAILYICTGSYTVFWKGFYESAERFLLPGFEKHYFVFTDAKKIYGEAQNNISVIYQAAEAWPYPTLNRFKYFSRIKNELAKQGYIFFFNSNATIIKEILPEDILPAGDEELVVTQHPGYWDKSPEHFTYDNNPDSTAFIEKGKGSVYVAGGLNGGRTDKYLAFISACLLLTEADLKKGIIARWHDESYLNKYILDKKVKILHPGFLYPAGWQLPFEKVIGLEDKKLFIKGYGKYSFWHKLKKKFFPERN